MPVPDDLVDEMTVFVSTQVSGGFSTRGEIVDATVEVFAGDVAEDDLREAAIAAVERAIRSKRLEERDWPPVTDCDRLDSAFDALERAGIVCRQNFTCCGTCGAAEIGDAIEDAIGNGAGVRGYAFYHEQDTESAAGGNGLYLNYGSVDEGEEPALAIAREVVEQLRLHGLRAAWSGSWNQRIEVALDWKRRFPDAGA